MTENDIQDSELPQQNQKFLRGSDVAGKLFKAKITAVGETTFQNRTAPVRNLTVEMDIGERSFALNKSNISALVQAYGKATRSWIGKTVQLTSTKKTNPTSGQLVDSIVVIAQD